MPEQDPAGGPRRQPCKPECRANTCSPERGERVKNQPVDGDRQFEEKNESGDTVEETHSNCFRGLFYEERVQRRVADQAQNQKRTAQREPGPLGPALVSAPQSPAHYCRARYHIEQARHSSYVWLRGHYSPRTLVISGGRHLIRCFACGRFRECRS